MEAHVAVTWEVGVAADPNQVVLQCPDKFVVGYGLDFNEEYRSLPFVGVLKPECYL